MRWKLPALLVVFFLIFSVIYVKNLKEKVSVGDETASGVKAVVMVLDRATYRVGDNLTLTIINNGSERLIVGSFYRLYRFENGKWREIPTGFSFTGLGYEIPPGKNWSQQIQLAVLVKGGSAFGTLEPLPPGRYRIEKTVSTGQGDEIRLSAEFEVIG